MAIVTDSACALCAQPMHPGHGWALPESALLHISCGIHSNGITKDPDAFYAADADTADVQSGPVPGVPVPWWSSFHGAPTRMGRVPVPEHAHGVMAGSLRPASRSWENTSAGSMCCRKRETREDQSSISPS